MPLDVVKGASLEDLAGRYLGSPRFAIAIALATNARSGDGFSYIANPDDLAGIARVCIPSRSEARLLSRSWEAYDRAVSAARLPRRSGIHDALVVLPPDQPVTVVAWVRKDQVERLKVAPGGWAHTAPSELWVTAEPHLQEFCRAVVRDRRPDETALTGRLEQRLGLAPASSKAYFVRIRLDHPGPDVIFRPCIDPAASQGNCAAGPAAIAPAAHQQWFYRQYYSSYGQSLLGEFPWTALGYTFDWAPGNGNGKGPGFSRLGESEFVIHKDAPIEVLDVVPTFQYCAPR